MHVGLQHDQDADQAGERDRVPEDEAQDRAFVAEPVGRRRRDDGRLASIIWPMTPPDEFAAAISTGLRPNCSEVIFCRFPKNTFEAVSDPVRATSSQPSSVPNGL